MEDQLWQVEYQDGSIEYVEVTVRREDDRAIYITEDYTINATSLINAIWEFGNENIHVKSIVVFQKVTDYSWVDKSIDFNEDDHRKSNGDIKDLIKMNKPKGVK